MKKGRPSLGSLRAFDAVAKFRSFKLAAEDIGVSATAISHQIRLLEDQLETRVFTRTPRTVELTPVGKHLYQATRQAFPLLQTAVDEINELLQPTVLTLSATTAFITCWLVPRLSEFMQQHPGIDLRLHADDNIVDLRAKRIDIAIRYGNRPDEDLLPTPLFDDNFILAASPALSITTPEDLLHAVLIHTDGRKWPQPTPDWSAWRDQFGPSELVTGKGPRFTDETHSIQAAIAGQGVVIASQLMLQDALENGLLEEPLPTRLPGATYYLVINPASRHPQAILMFKAWLLQYLQA
ncbi:LysR family transcriptional regulator [Chania multitudinisentens RB-25]|uniref:LysR family transcriptional regulator n=1 Tax=Chania multitudinisentens RB-25 TaxID=1441930 RepID=W0LBQ1_9GAMM|nr:LysR substrate-binding domain-containing protein [Chania multitudinisentens]AHG21161.1 LysR family transcriptional regulator [Chania multitudinisentens RB-25]